MKSKVIFINGHLNTGGVEKALLDILTHLDYDKFEVDLLLTEEYGDYISQVPKDVNVILRSLEGTYGSVIKVILKSIRSRDWFSLRMRLIFLLMRYFGCARISLARKMLTKGKQYDVAIGFRSGICTQIASYAVDAKKRLSWWHHGSINVNPENYLQDVAPCDNIVAVSMACRNMLIDEMPQLENRIVMIHNMLDPDEILKKTKQFVPQYDTSKISIVSVGRLAPEKHFDNAIYAARKLKDEGIEFQWHLIGDGVERDSLEKLACELCVEDVFIFEGNQPNPYPYIAHADLFVHPSYVESFGIVVAEALTLGRACVVTKSSGVMDSLIDGENALLTEQNADDLFYKVLAAITDNELRLNLQRRASLPSKLQPGSIVNKMEDLLLDTSANR